jgi:hypothetical protein
MTVLTPSLSLLLKVRLLVGFLGERAQFGWWPTAFYEASGRLFLEPVFPKTARLAQYHGVIEAARRVHDEHLSVGSFHLFRLPEEMEQDLHALLQAEPEHLFSAGFCQDKSVALDDLRNVASDAKTNVAGPVSIGKVEEINNHIQKIAAVYHSAFNSDAPSFPYLVK